MAGGNGSVEIVVVSAPPAPTPVPRPGPEAAAESAPPPAAPVASPTPTPIPTPSPTPVPTVLEPGSGTLVVNGVSVPVRVEPDAEGSGLVIAGEGIRIQISAAGPAGFRLPLALDGSLVLSQGGEFVLTGAGLEPNTVVTLFMFSTPVSLGTLPVSSSGAVSGALLIPAGSPPGDHVIQTIGRTADGRSLILSLGVKVMTPAAARGAHPVVSLGKLTVHPPGTAFEVSATGVQARCAVAFWVHGANASAKAGVAGRAVASLLAPTRSGRWAVTARVSGAGCEAMTVKTYLSVRD